MVYFSLHTITESAQMLLQVAFVTFVVGCALPPVIEKVAIDFLFNAKFFKFLVATFSMKITSCRMSISKNNK